MRATLLTRLHRPISERAYYEMVIWRVPEPVPGSRHHLKYRMALVVEGTCVLRYDNERGKGDHKHIDGREERIEFTSLAALIQAFRADMKRIVP